MKPIFKFFKNLFSSKISRLFFAANFIVCAAVFDWSKASQYYGKLNEIGCQPKAVLSFALYDMSGGGIIDGIIALLTGLILLAIFAVFAGPSGVMCQMILAVLKSAHPAWCDETFDLMTVPIFMMVNSIYAVLLGYLIELVYLKTTQNKPARKNPLSIYSG